MVGRWVSAETQTAVASTGHTPQSRPPDRHTSVPAKVSLQPVARNRMAWPEAPLQIVTVVNMPVPWDPAPHTSQTSRPLSWDCTRLCDREDVRRSACKAHILFRRSLPLCALSALIFGSNSPSLGTPFPGRWVGPAGTSLRSIRLTLPSARPEDSSALCVALIGKCASGRLKGCVIVCQSCMPVVTMNPPHSQPPSCSSDQFIHYGLTSPVHLATTGGSPSEPI